jgi:DNA-binding NarL/FixJ family response regulator
MRVCVIEPSALVRSRLVGLISELERVEFVFSSGRGDAVRAVERICPDLVILEVGASSRSGLARIVRLKRMSAAARVLVLTNDSSDEYRKRCLDVGADYFLDKSLEFDRLPAIVRSRAHRKPARRHNGRAHR